MGRVKSLPKARLVKASTQSSNKPLLKTRRTQTAPPPSPQIDPVTQRPRRKQSARRTQVPPPPLQQDSVISEDATASRKHTSPGRKDTSSSDDSDVTKVASDSDPVDAPGMDTRTTQDLVASALWNRYQEHGRLSDLEEAIRLDRASLAAQEAAFGSGAFDSLTAVNLGVSLFDLYNHTRAPEALDESVQLLERALVLMSEAQPAGPSGEGDTDIGVDVNVGVEKEHASLPRAKVNLGNAYRARAELRGDRADLDRAIELYEMVLLQTPAGHSTWDLEIRQNCLARSLMARGSQRDVERAMDLLSFRRAVRGEGAVDGIEGALREQEAALSARFKERYLGVYDADVGIPVPDLTGLVHRLTDFPSGCGGYADIFMGEWQRSRRFRQKIAIKILRRHAPATLSDAPAQVSDKVQKMIKAEVRIWHKLDHENVVKLLGTCRGFGPFPSLVCPWYAEGSLPAFLRKHKSLIYSERLRLIREVAKGLYFLHSNAIIHGDLTGANVLIDENHTACLTDFGLSVLARDFELPTMSSFSSGIGGSVRWTAPELYAFDDKQPTVTMYSDVYSFGCVTLEIFSGEIPYHNVQHEMEVLLKYVVPGIKPERPRTYKKILDRHWSAAEQCWATDPSARPSSKILPELFEDLPNKES